MKIACEDEGLLTIELQAEEDWKVFKMLFDDAKGRSDDWLAKQLGVLVGDDDWDDYVVPDLSRQFSVQLNAVQSDWQTAYDNREDECGQMTINQVNGEAWYSTLNQARLALEGQWKLAAAEEKGEFDDPESADPERLSAFFRSRLYCFFQAQLIECVLD